MRTRLTIISGGQTGVDQAALRAAHRCGLATGGWMPHGAMTEDGPRPDLLRRYHLRAHRARTYPPRTRANVQDAACTVWLGPETGRGLRCTGRACEDLDKPCILNPSLTTLRWLVRHYRCVNIAGPSERSAPGIGARMEAFCVRAFTPLKGSRS